MSGVSLSEVLSLLSRLHKADDYDNFVNKVKADRNSKIISPFEQRIGIVPENMREISKSGHKNILDVLESIYGNPFTMGDSIKESFYEDALSQYSSSRTASEDNSARFNYFMIFTIDVAGEVDCEGKANPHNILFDAYNTALGLTLAHESWKRERCDDGIHIVTGDEDIGNMLFDMEDKLVDVGTGSRPYNPKVGVSDKEKELIHDLDKSIMNICVEPKEKYKKDLGKRYL